MINDLSIKIIHCEAGDNKFTIDFMVPSQTDLQVMCYLLSLILAGKNTTFGPLDTKTMTEEFQEQYYKTKNLFPNIIQWDMVFSITVDYSEKRQSYKCKFRQGEENMDVEVLCVVSDNGGIRIDFHVANELQLENASCFIYTVIRGKGANQGWDFVHRIMEQFKEAFTQQKAQNVLTTYKDVSFMYAVLYETGEQKFVCYT